MLFHIMFFFMLSMIIISSSWLIYKSKLTTTERFFSIFAIFLLFTSITTLNEYKQPDLTVLFNQTELTKQKIVSELERRFYLPFHNINVNHYKLPVMNHGLDHLKEQLNFSDFFSTSTPLFWCIEAKSQLGLSFALREYTRHLQNYDYPILYLNLKEEEVRSFLELEIVMRIQNVELLEELIERMNEKNIVPTVIIDGAERTMKNEEREGKWGKESDVLDFFIRIYKKRMFKSLIVFYDREALLDYIGKLMFISELKKIGSIFNEKDSLEKYLLEEINRNIKDDVKRISKENFRRLKDDWHQFLNFRMIYEYHTNYRKYVNFENFLKSFSFEKVKKQLKTSSSAANFYYNTLLPILTRKNDKNLTITTFESKAKISYIKSLLNKEEDFEYLEKLEKLGILSFSMGSAIVSLAWQEDNKTKEKIEDDLEMIEI